MDVSVSLFHLFLSDGVRENAAKLALAALVALQITEEGEAARYINI